MWDAAEGSLGLEGEQIGDLVEADGHAFVMEPMKYDKVTARVFAIVNF